MRSILNGLILNTNSFSEQRDVRTSELRMINELMVSDIKQEISDIQTELKQMNDEADALREKSIAENAVPSTGSEKQENIESKPFATVPDSMDANNEKLVKCEPELAATTSCDKKINKSFNSSPAISATVANALQSPSALDDKSSLHETLQKEQHHQQQHHLPLDLDYQFESHTPTYDIKKEMENFDVESEITPSYIIKKCDASLSIPPPSFSLPLPPPQPPAAPLPPPPTTTAVMSTPNVSVPTTSMASTPSTTVRDSLCELDSSDFNYLYNSSTSTASTVTPTPTLPTSNSSNRKKDELISCDKEPYDEWLCIQKELNLITEKRSNEHMNKCNLIDGYMDTCSTSKLSVDNHFPDLFNHHQTNHHDTLDGKAEIHSPLSDLFNESIVGNTVGSVSDKTVENHLENMFSDSSEFEKTNDLVESRLEELFHGSSSPDVQSTAPQAIGNQVYADTQQHVDNHSDFLMMHQNAGVTNQMPSTASTNKRLWPSSADLMETMSSDQMHQQKRSCMMTTYMETASTSLERQWMMDCQQSSTFDFMAGNEPNLDTTSANAKRLWNGTNDCAGNGDGSGGGASTDGSGTGNIVMNGMPCDNSNNVNNDTNMLMSSIDTKKQCYNNAVKNHDLELTLLGCTSSLHNENSFDASTMPGSGSTANTSNNSIASNFEDDINRHVQNAIDSILNLQNSESEALHYLDQTMGSFLNDSPLVPNYPSNTGVTSTATHLSQSASLPTASVSRTQHPLHQQTINLQQHQPQPQQQHHYDDTSDCLISGSRSGMNDASVDMMIDSPPTLITS